MRRNNTTTLTNGDTCIVMGELYYTVSGAMKMLNVGKNSIVNSVKDGTLEVFEHPSGNLFSRNALSAWIAKRTVKAGK